MKESVSFGMNKTGIQMSPRLTSEMLEGRSEFQASSLDTSMTSAQIKQEYIADSKPIGTVPLPGTAKGALNVGLNMIKNSHPEVLIDKLGERLAFERASIRLYEALIVKCEATMSDMPLDLLYQFREDEMQHFRLLWETMEKIGVDPTAQTPCADLSGIVSMGLIQILNDSRSTVTQSVQAIMIAERTDTDGWDFLTRLMEDSGLKEEAEKFREAKRTEDNHLLHISQWLENLLVKNDRVPLQ